MPLYRVIRRTITRSDIIVEADNDVEALDLGTSCDSSERWSEADEADHEDDYEVEAVEEEEDEASAVDN